MKRVLLVILPAVVFGIATLGDTSAHDSPVSRYIGFPPGYGASIIKPSGSNWLTCDYNSGWKSINYAASSWNSVAFAPNGTVPYFMTSPNCNIQVSEFSHT
jgi:hypothetical protein